MNPVFDISELIPTFVRFFKRSAMWTIEKYKEIYSRYESSGLAVEQFCYNERISRSRFYYWKRKYEKLPDTGISINHTPDAADSRMKGTGFIPVWLTSDNKCREHAEKGSDKKVETSPPGSTGSVYMVELSYQNGTSVRFTGKRDMELVKTLISR